MGFFATIGQWVNFVLDPIFSPLLKLGPFWAILIVSFVVSFLITIIYKWVTDQEMMKALKEDIKKMQKEMKSLRSDPQKMMKVQKKAMEKNMKYMMHSFKPTLITMIPLILIFGWLNTNMGYHPLSPGEEFTTTVNFEEGVLGNVTLIAPGLDILSANPVSIKIQKAMWKLKGETGEYQVTYEFSGGKTYTNELVIQDKNGYKPPEKRVKDGIVNSISVNLKKIIVLNLFGWKLGWLGAYIIFSIVFSMGLRKLMKVY